MITEQQMVELAAEVAHETNRMYCKNVLKDNTAVPWSEAPDWQKSSCYNGVRGVIQGNTERTSHENWLKEKAENGWKWGYVKDPEKKEHPCFVPYDELPQHEKIKDALFVRVVKGVLDALGYAWGPGI